MEDEYSFDPTISSDQQAGLGHSPCTYLPGKFSNLINIASKDEDEQQQQQEQEQEQEQQQQQETMTPEEREHAMLMEQQIKEVFNTKTYDAIGLAVKLVEKVKERTASFSRITTRLLKATSKIEAIIDDANASYCKASAPWGPPKVDFILDDSSSAASSSSSSTATIDDDDDDSFDSTSLVAISPFENTLITLDSLLSEHCEKNDAFCFNTLILLNILSKLGDAYDLADSELRPQYHSSNVSDVHIGSRVIEPASKKTTDSSPLLPTPPYPEQRTLTNSSVISHLPDPKLRKIDWAAYDLDPVKIPGIIDPYDLSIMEPIDTHEFLKETKEHRILLGEQTEGEDASATVLERLTAKINSQEYKEEQERKRNSEEEEDDDDESNPFKVTIMKEEYECNPDSSSQGAMIDNKE